MSAPLPPFGSIRAFEAAARLLSFTKAAAELGMTQAAVSWQIKTMEQRLGAALFHRRHQRLELTPVGAALLPGVTDALTRLKRSFEDALAVGRAQVLLRISATPTFANNWLAPRLGRFRKIHPEIAVRLEASTRIANLSRQESDVTVRRGTGNWRGVTSHWLFPVTLAPFAAPSLIGRKRKWTAAEVLRLPLLQPPSLWKRWLDHVGYRGALPRGGGASLPRQHMVIEAAVSGQGAALLHPAFCTDAVQSGRLIQLMPDIFEDGQDGYWLVHRGGAAETREAVEFRDWIQTEIENAAAGSSKCKPVRMRRYSKTRAAGGA